jgi:dihydrofolate synthase / folylpolyglutamate synthase
MKVKQTRLKINPSLVQVKSALDKLDDPQDSFKSIHVAGTNGKGSVCSLLEGLFLYTFDKESKEYSFRIGKYISPHLESYTERISINGKDITEEEYQVLWEELFSKEDSKLKNEPLTEFERITILAFEYFKRKKIDIAILEVGLGGRWDATNVIKAENTLATAITNIDFDHMDYLGDSLEKIRFEKEGIKKIGVAHFELSTEELINSNVQDPNSKNGVNFFLAEKIFRSLPIEKSKFDLLSNSEAYDTILRIFRSRYRGRFELNHEKKILIDAAHNPAGAKQLNIFIHKKLLPSLNSSQRLIFLLGFLDKDHKNFIDNLVLNFCKDLNLRFIITKPNSERGREPKEVQEYLESHYDYKSSIVMNPSEALKLAQESQGNDWIIISGSIYLIGELLQTGL